ncbi:hypothetical protein [Paenibacillus segetis]|uniref:MarR family transcriptional regulator n=1 Tax=Paenibacillus segetis TaxID=1325360 RepID=A0ABQ1YL01_9BACL|nr:hypothetical protein [Paenibacillus segetis]GGH28493.1 hypothetical protein GCM10008013_30540 [Paenibacillus segetis]
MLPDLERKLLRILYNFSSKRRRMPEIGELERMTGRTKGDVLSGLSVLEQETYISWPDKPDLHSIVVVEGWDRGKPVRLWY